MVIFQNKNLFLAYFPKVGLCDLHPVCVSVYPHYQLLNAWTNLYETWYVYHANWAHLTVYFRNPSRQSVCTCIPATVARQRSVKCIPPFGARQRLGKHVQAAKNTRNIRRIIGRVIFYAIRVLSKEGLWVCLHIPLSLLGNGSAKTFSWQRRTVGGVVFYAVHVVSKENRRSVPSGTSCSISFLSSYNVRVYHVATLLVLLK
jgi:hypothetical protein